MCLFGLCLAGRARRQIPPNVKWNWSRVAGILRNYIGICFLAAAIVPALAFASPGEPDMPPGKDPGGVAVAIIDSGINYTLGFVAPRLARDAKGQILGYDFQDNDRLPFDLVPGQKPDSGRHHGTRVAGIFLREAPKARLIPYRYHAHSFGTFARIVETIATSPARIVIMSLGGYRKNDWAHFETAARANPKLLFIISAGNDGRDIDEKPVYPSSYKLDNALVVASTDNFGRLPPSSNWGTKTVDISTPGEEIETIDHAGTKTFVSGSSFAVPRIAALAARLQAANPSWQAQDIKKAILDLAGPSPGDRTPRTVYGWIANPALAGPQTE